MEGFQTFPDMRDISRAMDMTPDYMRPSPVPSAVIFEGYLSAQECYFISERLGELEPYRSPHCGALTRECEWDASLARVDALTRGVNEGLFKLDIDAGSRTWLQTYSSGESYQRHMDGSPGQTRKLTAVALLTDPLEYGGGDLRLFYHPREKLVPRTRGTVAIFVGWLEHEVSRVFYGSRQTINMGFWGPALR